MHVTPERAARATGGAGPVAVRAIHRRPEPEPEPELTGVCVQAPVKAGRDTGDVETET